MSDEWYYPDKDPLPEGIRVEENPYIDMKWLRGMMVSRMGMGLMQSGGYDFNTSWQIPLKISNQLDIPRGQQKFVDE